ncbi:hypothetical protein RHGRI_023592 [Rhododendron griersonianum]|uniref:TIR domain-containing protein n=1 Tax=Rhododendron griersonianum TaxID=479676 RepID=A0AAV6J6E3_9ERIC|nr:hypothetical protein RHGRI_023592 [Rhododendron griersonianum]
MYHSFFGDSEFFRFSLHMYSGSFCRSQWCLSKSRLLDYSSLRICSMAVAGCAYDIFLSFRGKDTRKTFTDHLYVALVQAGCHTFRDDDEIVRGEDIESELQKAIEQSRISIVVFSKTYACSRWCLEELVKILHHKKTSRHEVLPIFYDVDPSDVRKQTGSFAEAFTRHEMRLGTETNERNEEWMKKLEHWRAALRDVSNLAGMVLQNEFDGYEAKFIQKIVNVIRDKLNRRDLSISPFLVGILPQVRIINLWMQDGAMDASIIAICGMGGIGKTTIAKSVYNLNRENFDGSSFLANIRQRSQEPNGLVKLQQQLISDIGKEQKLRCVDEGIIKIADAISCKRLLLVLDDVDQVDQLHTVSPLNNEDSLELFSLHAFGQAHPIDDFLEYAMRVIHYCRGLPLALQVLGSSLSGRSVDVWVSALKKLEAIPDGQILRTLMISYDCLQDDHDKELFLHIACFFVGRDRDWTINILDECDFYTTIGIQNLKDTCLLTVDVFNNLEMHKLLQDMGREIVRQESPKELGSRTRLWRDNDSFKVLRENLLVALDLQYSNLKRVWEGTKFCKTLKILDLSHSQELTKTPDFSGVPNLEELILEDCVNLVKIHESIEKLEGLILLNLEDCKNLKNLPRNICMLKSLKTLIISGCSNLDWWPTEGQKIGSLKVLHTYGVRVKQSASEVVKSWQGIIRSRTSKPRKSPDISSFQLPRSLVKLSLAGSNLFNDDFPLDFSNMPLPEYLDLSANNICSLPESVRGLTGLRKLLVDSCKRLTSLTGKLFEGGVYSYFLPGDEIPSVFSIKAKGSSLSFLVPSRAHYKIQGFVICCIYTTWKNLVTVSDFLAPLTTKIDNKTKHVKCAHCPVSIGIPKANENMIWISHWNSRDLLDGGDEVVVSVHPMEFYVGLTQEKGRCTFEVKEVGVIFLYERQGEIATHETFACKDMVPGDLSPQEMLYSVGGRSVVRHKRHFSGGPLQSASYTLARDTAPEVMYWCQTLSLSGHVQHSN